MFSVQNLNVTINQKTILKDVSFDLAKGETLCIIGESGSGKTSLLRALQGIVPTKFKEFHFERAVTKPVHFQRKWQGPIGLPGSRWVMQDPIAALNPRQKLGRSIAESLFPERLPALEVNKRVLSALKDVELPAHFAQRLPSEVSLGQAQRACLARALVAKPELIFFDEPLSALDAIVQKQVAATMKSLQQRAHLTFVIVTHDLGFAAAYADQILVLRLGRVEAYQPVETFFKQPASSYCKDLIEAANDLGELGPAESPKLEVAH